MFVFQSAFERKYKSDLRYDELFQNYNKLTMFCLFIGSF